jgi:hypothetical protein
MSTSPFLTVRIRGQKDAVRLRHRARQIASLLHFPAHEQACIAAATFIIACQLLRLPGLHAVAFTIEDDHLHVAAQPALEQDGPVNRLMSLLGTPAEAPLRLVKRLPGDRAMGDADLAWLVANTKDAPVRLFEEIVRQNQEVLTLLHELHALQPQPASGERPRPHAA